MRIQVQLFAAARDRVGQERIEVDLSAAPTVGELRAALNNDYPDLAAIASHLMIAVNDDYATDDVLLPADARVACFPPVSGG